MGCDYVLIRAENERRYGTDIGRIGPLLLAHRYADRTHFIFELLQNAEGALARRRGWDGLRAVTFELSKTELKVWHFGIPFDETDVRSICGIADTTKNLASIGRFGIGFKSVYAFTDCPEVHSGEEDFAIESFVWPQTVPPITCRPDCVFPENRLVVFVDGYFWDGCARCYRRPRSNQRYWDAKVEANRRRDRAERRRLRRDGWQVLSIWGHEVTESPTGACKKVIRRLLQ